MVVTDECACGPLLVASAGSPPDAADCPTGLLDRRPERVDDDDVDEMEERGIDAADDELQDDEDEDVEDEEMDDSDDGGSVNLVGSDDDDDFAVKDAKYSNRNQLMPLQAGRRLWRLGGCA
jgi:hypothetical protein